MALQLSGSVNLTGDISLQSGSITLQTGSIVLTTGSVTVLTGSVTSPNVIYTLVFDDMEFNHVSGSRSYFAGVGIPITASSFGAGIVDGNLVLQPTASAPYSKYEAFKTIYRNARLVSYRMYTNLSGSDFPVYDYNSNGPKISYVSVGFASKTTANGATSGQSISNLMYSLTPGTYDGADGDGWETFLPGAVINTPNEIMDAGTLYKDSPPPYEISFAPTEYSPTYFTFLMSIGAAFATKTYKFRFELDIEDNGLPVV